jgi:hypothetical protein
VARPCFPQAHERLLQPRRAGVRPRARGDGELVDLTEDDIRLWMFWLGLDYILHR